MANIAEMYTEELNPTNEVKGFTKSFVKRTKDKKTEDLSVKEVLTLAKENKIQIGAKTAEKHFKNGNVAKVFVALNCEELTLKKLRHYAKLANVEVVKLELSNSELAQKLGKPFLVSVLFVRNN